MSNKQAPLWRGFSILLTVFLLSSCGSSLETFSGKTFELSYDSGVFGELNRSTDEIKLNIKGESDSPIISAIVVYPFVLDKELSLSEYLDGAQDSFESKFSQVSNLIPSTSQSEGVLERRVSISGTFEEKKGSATGFLRVLASSETLFQIEVIGQSEKINKFLSPINELLDSAMVFTKPR